MKISPTIQKSLVLIFVILLISCKDQRLLTSNARFKNNVKQLNERLYSDLSFSCDPKLLLELMARVKARYGNLQIDKYTADAVWQVITEAYTVNKKEPCPRLSIQEMERRLNYVLNKAFNEVKKDKQSGAGLIERIKKAICPLYPFCS